MKRRRLTLLTMGFMFIVILATAVSLPGRVEGVSRFNVDVQAYDALTVLIDPAVEGLTAHCTPLGHSEPFYLYVASNTSETSYVQLYTESESDYNITIGFESPTLWQIRVGVLTTKPYAYTGYLSVEQQGSRYFVELASQVNEEPGSYLVSILTHARGVEEKGETDIQLPSMFYSTFVVAVALPLLYVNSFAVADSYFKSKVEGVSRTRKLAVGGLIIMSVLFVYWVSTVAPVTMPVQGAK